MLDVILLVFPNQLFPKHPGLKKKPSQVVLIEDSLFFGNVRSSLRFHKQKLWLHRATMKRYELMLRDQGFATHYVDYDESTEALKHQLEKLIDQSRPTDKQIVTIDPTDYLLEKRLRRHCTALGLECKFLPSPGFINLREENDEFRAGKKRWFMADFYKWQRKRLDILMEGDEPVGGRWSFDEDNRHKVPKSQLASIPSIPGPKRDSVDDEATSYVEERFPDNPGKLERLYYPSSHADARRWLDDFLNHRFEKFGAYEDAIVEGQSWLWHSVLTPCLNSGLLTPAEVLKTTLRFAEKHDVPLNSLEGFVRQVIGWREFMRATYQDLGVRMRTTNHWGHQRPMPSSFYDGTTGIRPIDDTIERIQETGYCHHIERLMVLGGFMFLCEIDPDAIYAWFMEMFVDSYDWVMVPNVYAMSQHADGGLITTKPYFSGSSYVRKMSHYKKGDWCDAWDGLYWRWIWNHRQQLGKNARWAMMCRMAEKMDESKRERHLQVADQFLGKLFTSQSPA